MTWAEAIKDIIEVVCGLLALVALAAVLESSILPWNGTKRSNKETEDEEK